MSDDKNQKTQDASMWFPKFVELWKEFYFKTEEAWADAFVNMSVRIVLSGPDSS